MRTTTRLALLATATLALAPTFGVLASARPALEPPSRSQLERLYELDPYVRYFTARTYGPQQTRVPANYIRALILTESGTDVMARSPVGARGLTQIMPPTAREALDELARDGGEFAFVDSRIYEQFAEDDLFDPAVNILIACHLTAKYLAKYDQDTDLVVSAWNAGPTAVARHGRRPPPYPETLTTIARVNHYVRFLRGTSIY
jgi:soluble lytic murein transglycosylase-like protein